MLKNLSIKMFIYPIVFYYALSIYALKYLKGGKHEK